MNHEDSKVSEDLDPRVQVELERLNTATDEINGLELQLEEERLALQRLLDQGHLTLHRLSAKLALSIQKARPYYDARFRATLAAQELQAAVIALDKANSAHTAAKEMVYLAEEGLARQAGTAGSTSAGVSLDPAWQEMLNHATARVNQAECERVEAGAARAAAATRLRAARVHHAHLQRALHKHITKSKPYYAESARLKEEAARVAARVSTLQGAVGAAKARYAAALRALERISAEIHRHRAHPASPAHAHAHAWTDVDLRPSPEDTPAPAGTQFGEGGGAMSRVSSLETRRIICGVGHPAHAPRACVQPRTACPPRPAPSRRQSLDLILTDTGDRVKEMFQGLSLWGERRGSAGSRGADTASEPDTDRLSDTDSLAGEEMLSDEQIASLMLSTPLPSPPRAASPLSRPHASPAPALTFLNGHGSHRSPSSPNNQLSSSSSDEPVDRSKQDGCIRLTDSETSSTTSAGA